MDLSGLTQQAEDTNPEQPVYSAQVVRADESGLWVVPLGEDPSNPVGPCKGGWTANGTRVPPGALVALLLTADGPWAIGVDNPALAIVDTTLAPFANPSFEAITTDEPPQAQSWSRFSLFGNVSTEEVLTGTGAAHGQRFYRIAKNGAGGRYLQSTPWTVLAGSSFEVGAYLRRVVGDPRVKLMIYSTAPGMGEPGILNPNSVLTSGGITHDPTDDWLRYRSTVTPPPTHTRVSVLVEIGTGDGNPATLDIDNVDADLVVLDASVAHGDFMRRAALTIAGGGARTVTAGGNVAWSQPFTIAGAGREATEAIDGRFEIARPADGTVIPVHSSGTRTSHTVAGGVIALDADEALWYELPLGAVFTSQPARFHILGGSAADGYDVPANWMLVVRRTAWSTTARGPEYRWGDGRLHDPWRTPTFTGSPLWVDGTSPARYRKIDGGSSVQLRGRVANGAGGAFTMPNGYAPPSGHTHTALVRDGAGAVAVLTVSPAGVVTPAGNNTDHSIDTIFPVDA